MRTVKITGYSGRNWLKQVVLGGQREKELFNWGERASTDW